MSGLLSDEKQSEEEGSRSVGTFDIAVSGVFYHNSAIKFWTGLMDEAVVYYPNCDTIILETTADQPLSTKDLDPQAELEEAAQEFDTGNIAELFQRTIQQMQLLGAPQPVEAYLLRNGEEEFRRTLPLECVDANLFPYLVAWLLYLADVAPCSWGAEMMTGGFEAVDKTRSLSYEIRFIIRNTHLHEGLFRRRVQVKYSVF